MLKRGKEQVKGGEGVIFFIGCESRLLREGDI